MMAIILALLLPFAIVVIATVAVDLLTVLWFCDWSVPAMIRWLIAAAHEQNETRSS